MFYLYSTIPQLKDTLHSKTNRHRRRIRGQKKTYKKKKTKQTLTQIPQLLGEETNY